MNSLNILEPPRECYNHSGLIFLLRQLLKTTVGNGNKSPHRPLSAGGIKSPDENSGTARVRCKSAQPMNRGQQQVAEDEKKGEVGITS